jgi:hypothetical protein
MEQKLRLYEIVRPSKKWIDAKLDDAIFSVDFITEIEEQKIRKRGGLFYLKSVGYINKIGQYGYSVRWITESYDGCYYRLHSAWWKESELEVIGNALKICKDLI